MLRTINFPEGITWDIKYLNGYDMCGEGFSVTTMEYAYTQGQMNVIDIKYDTSKVTDFSCAFYYCQKLIKCPDIDMTSATSASYMFYCCTALRNIPFFNTPNLSNMSNMFNSCNYLKSIPLLDCGKVSSMSTMFGWSDLPSLTDLGGFKNLKINCTGNLNLLPNLTVQSLMNVINNLYDFRANGSTTTKTLQLGTTNLNKLTDEQKAVATNKGWSLT